MTEQQSGSGSTERLTRLLAASTIGVYILVVVGGTTALLDGASACSTWPACGGQWMLPSWEPAVAVAWGHQALTLVVGLLLLATTVIAWTDSVPRRVRGALGVAAALYPGQIVLGALTATRGAPPLFSNAHLVVAMGIFTGLLVALLWQLEATVPDSGRRNNIDAPAREPPTTNQSERDSGPTDPSSPGMLASARAYLRLTKPKLMWLLCLVALAAMGLAAGPTLEYRRAAATLLGGVLAIGSSGVFNNVLERDVDQHMSRTADRPLVRDQIPVRRAIGFGVLLAIGSVGLFLAFVNPFAAALGLLAILFYSVVYTVLLKPHTDQNIVIGGAVGAFPALIGWAAVENTVGVPAVVLGAVIFLWTPAHFYNLALAYKQDYAAGGFPMLPVVRGDATTRRHIILYLGATLLGAVVLGSMTKLGWVYAVTSILVGAVFLWAAIRLFQEQTEQAAFRTFHASNAYLGALLLAVLVDTLFV